MEKDVGFIGSNRRSVQFRSEIDTKERLVKRYVHATSETSGMWGVYADNEWGHAVSHRCESPATMNEATR